MATARSLNIRFSTATVSAQTQNDCHDISADYQEIPQSVARTSRTIPCQSTIDHDHAFIPHRIPAFFITPQAIHHGI